MRTLLSIILVLCIGAFAANDVNAVPQRGRAKKSNVHKLSKDRSVYQSSGHSRFEHAHERLKQNIRMTGGCNGPNTISNEEIIRRIEELKNRKGSPATEWLKPIDGLDASQLKERIKWLEDSEKNPPKGRIVPIFDPFGNVKEDSVGNQYNKLPASVLAAPVAPHLP